jgi:hypothetical protein
MLAAAPLVLVLVLVEQALLYAALSVVVTAALVERVFTAVAAAVADMQVMVVKVRLRAH